MARGDVNLTLGNLRPLPALRAVAPALGPGVLPQRDLDPERVTEGGGHLLELENPSGIGCLVNAVERRRAILFEPRGDGLVRRQHELLDDAMRYVALGRDDAGHLPELVEHNFRGGQVKVDGAAPLPAVVEDHRQILHPPEPLDQRLVALPRFSVSLKHVVHAGVGHTLDAADDAAAELSANGLAAVIDLE